MRPKKLARFADRLRRLANQHGTHTRFLGSPPWLKGPERRIEVVMHEIAHIVTLEGRVEAIDEVANWQKYLIEKFNGLGISKTMSDAFEMEAIVVELATLNLFDIHLDVEKMFYYAAENFRAFHIYTDSSNGRILIEGLRYTIQTDVFVRNTAMLIYDRLLPLAS